MSNELLKVKENLALTTGSLSDLIQQRKTRRVTMLLVDYSVSMGGLTEDRGQRKIDALRMIAKQLKRDFPRCLQIGFGYRVGFIESVPEPAGTTPLHKAIAFAAKHKAGHLIVISDGRPDDPQRALAEATAFGGPIDVFYVGPHPDAGEDFLRRLSLASGGQFASTTLAAPKALETRIRGCLSDGRKP